MWLRVARCAAAANLGHLLLRTVLRSWRVNYERNLAEDAATAEAATAVAASNHLSVLPTSPTTTALPVPGQAVRAPITSRVRAATTGLPCSVGQTEGLTTSPTYTACSFG